MKHYQTLAVAVAAVFFCSKSFNGFASVTDTYNCNLQLINAEGRADLGVAADFDAVRKQALFPVPAGVTQSSFALHLNPRTSLSFSASVRVSYLIGYQGGSKAYQSGCTTVTYCDSRSSGKPCFSSACAGLPVQPDPARPFDGWKEIPVFNGVPQVDTSSFSVREILNTGEVLEGSCSLRSALP
jgi:hypothetical protein